MTRSTHSKSRKPRNQKQISQKRGTRKPQRGGAWYDFLPYLKFNKAETAPSDGQSEEEKKGNALKAELTSTLKTLTNLLPKVKLCPAEEVKREPPPEPAGSDTISETLTEQPALDKPMGGGMSNRGNRRSNRRGRGRAPPKKGSKKGMFGQRKVGAIIF